MSASVKNAPGEQRNAASSRSSPARPTLNAELGTSVGARRRAIRDHVDRAPAAAGHAEGSRIALAASTPGSPQVRASDPWSRNARRRAGSLPYSCVRGAGRVPCQQALRLEAQVAAPATSRKLLSIKAPPPRRAPRPGPHRPPPARCAAAGPGWTPHPPARPRVLCSASPSRPRDLQRRQRGRRAARDQGQASVMPSTCGSMRASPSRGHRGRRDGHEQLRPHHAASTRPRAPPSKREQQALGQELAHQPAAARAQRRRGSRSRCARSAARASSRFATLAQAMSSTKATAPRSIKRPAGRRRRGVPQGRDRPACRLALGIGLLERRAEATDLARAASAIDARARGAPTTAPEWLPRSCQSRLRRLSG